MKNTYLDIELGSTGIKACLIDPDGSPVAMVLCNNCCGEIDALYGTSCCF